MGVDLPSALNPVGDFSCQGMDQWMICGRFVFNFPSPKRTWFPPNHVSTKNFSTLSWMLVPGSKVTLCTDKQGSEWATELEKLTFWNRCLD